MHKRRTKTDQSKKTCTHCSVQFLVNFLILMNFLAFYCQCNQNTKLPTRIFNIAKSDEQLPIIILSDLSPQFDSISLILDSGSEQLALFDNQCSSCINTFSACPHIKTLNNQNYISYLLTQFKGDFSYLTLAQQLRIRFFCVLEINSNPHSLTTNGILGVNFPKKNLKGLKLKQGNGLKTWRKIIHKIYNQHSQQKNQENQQYKKQKFKSLSYSIFYSRYHTQLILGNLPQYFDTNYIGQYSLKQKIYVLQMYFFPSQKIVSEDDGKIEVHFDTGSSVMVLSFQLFQTFFETLKLQISQQCQLTQTLVQCPKSSLQKLILSDFKLTIKIGQGETSQNKEFQIQLQNLIDINSKTDPKMFTFKIYGYKSQNQNESEMIILGVPFFKQYLVQFDFPFQSGEKSNFILQKDFLFDQQQSNYWIRIYGHKILQKQDAFSSYDRLIRKQQKNIKILLFIYIFLFVSVSYLLIKFYWLVHQLIEGKRSIV